MPFMPYMWNYERECAVAFLHWITFQPAAAHIANPLVQHPVSRPSITGIEQQKHGFSSALKSTHAKIFLSDQPLHGSGQSGREITDAVWVATEKASAEVFQFWSHHWVSTASRQWTWRAGQESSDHSDWDSFRNTFPTILSTGTATHTLLFTQPSLLRWSLDCPL